MQCLCQSVATSISHPCSISSTKIYYCLSLLGVTSLATPTFQDVVKGHTDIYFITAVVISAVGGVIAAVIIIVIAASAIIMVKYRRLEHHTFSQQAPPPVISKYEKTTKNSILDLKSSPPAVPKFREKPSLNPSLSLISVDSNYHSGKFSSHSTLSHSGKSNSASTLSDSSKSADCPQKPLETTV